MTNADRIRQTTDDNQLIRLIGTGCHRCAFHDNCDSGVLSYVIGDCVQGNLKWLQQQAENESEVQNAD